MDYIIIFDVIIAGLGAYLVYSALKMKKSGEISSLLVNRETMKSCRDKKGFIDNIYLKMIFFGIVSMVFGLLGGIDDMIYKFDRIYEIAGVAVYLAVCFWFSREVRKESEKYF